MPHSGHCLCLDIKIDIASTHSSHDACDCSECRKFTGSVKATMVIVKKGDLTITGTPKTYVSPGATGKPVTRTFCGNCGSPLSMTCDLLEGNTIILTGNFQDFVEMSFGQQRNEELTWKGFWECHSPGARLRGEWDWGAVHVWHIAV